MNKFIVGVIGGAAVGAVVSHFATKHVLEESINERVSKEYRALLQDMENTIDGHRAVLHDIEENAVSKDDVVVYDYEEGDTEEEATEETEEPDPSDETDYTKFAKVDDRVLVTDKPDLEEYAKQVEAEREYHYPADLVEEAARVFDERVESDTHNLTPIRPEEPYILEMSEYDTAYKNDKVSYTWWEGSQTLTDEDEDIIADIDGVIGMRNLEAFGTELADPGDPDVIYIRNDRLGLDINLVRDPRNYFTDI